MYAVGAQWFLKVEVERLKVIVIEMNVVWKADYIHLVNTRGAS